MANADAFKIISVTGAHSSVGKTTLCAVLLEYLKGFGGVKFTKTALYTSVTEDEKILGETGKDTAVYLAAGAEKVVWIQSPGGAELRDALNIALSKMAGLKGVVVEGNSPLKFLRPDLVIFIIRQDGRIKPSAVETGKQADIIIINSGEKGEYPSSLTRILRENTKVFYVDVVGRKGEIDKFLAYVKEYINKERLNLAN
ncbi:MAG: hypothetical protein C4526_11860 [Nitrospiraceae bacterium]|nr:MAG: hypothetical protein C4526_11860 [Nitrospiraceae bacterium]